MDWKSIVIRLLFAACSEAFRVYTTSKAVNGQLTEKVDNALKNVQK